MDALVQPIVSVNPTGLMKAWCADYYTFDAVILGAVRHVRLQLQPIRDRRIARRVSRRTGRKFRWTPHEGATMR